VRFGASCSRIISRVDGNFCERLSIPRFREGDEAELRKSKAATCMQGCSTLSLRLAAKHSD
jgi:hypothetical protein